MKTRDCLEIILECVGDGLKNKFDYLTSTDKKQVQDTCENMLYAIEEAIRLGEKE